MFNIFWTKSNSDQYIKKYTVFAQYYFPSSKKKVTLDLFVTPFIPVVLFS